MEHTKGKWGVRKVDWQDKDNFLDTVALQIFSDKHKGWTLATLGVDWSEAEVNAQLMASAPEMYEALEMVRSEVDWEILSEVCKDEVEQALAKAGG